LLAADATGTPHDEMLMCATGTIGPRIPVDDVSPAVLLAAEELSEEGGEDAALAITTTDTRPKTASRTFSVNGTYVTVGGMAKGAGTIAPRMELSSTLLVFVTTDAAVDAAGLQAALAPAVESTFNAITIDGCMSTSDTVLLFANGASGVNANGSAAFAQAVHDVMAD